MDDLNQELMATNWRALIRPRRLEVEEPTLTEMYGRFACEPLERGFGITLGNALRRVLLSSLQGAAITTVKIEGVLHEFSTIPGVHQDVADLILNLKEVRLRLHSLESKTIRIQKKGAGEILAGDLGGEDSSVEILNPDHRIATLAGDAEVEMEVTIANGKGYVLAEKNKPEEMPIGTIPIDAIFSPVHRVNYTVTPARVGRETDFDRLNLEVWTDGTVAPADAVAYAAKILKDQLTIFINFEEPEEAPLPAADEPEPLNPNLFRSVDELELSLRELPAERQHPLHRRAGAEDRVRDAEDEELRSEVPERDQGSAGLHGPGARHEARLLPPAQGDREAAGARGLDPCDTRSRGASSAGRAPTARPCSGTS